MSPLLALLLFTFAYAIMACVCGVVSWKAWTTSSKEVKTTSESLKSAGLFLAGTALAPFVMSLVQALPLLVFDKVSNPILWGWYVIAFGALSGLTFKWLQEFWSSVSGNLLNSTERKLGATFISVVIAVVLVWAWRCTTLPFYDFDITYYAGNARALLNHTELHTHNHGLSFDYFLSMAQTFHPTQQEDLAVRWAPRLLVVHEFIVLTGLGLCISPYVALLSPVFLLSYTFLGPILISATRDPFRDMAVLFLSVQFCVMMAPFDMNLRTIIFFSGFAFLWNSHSSSLLAGPILAGLFAILNSGWRNRVIIVFLSALSLYAAINANLRYTIELKFFTPKYEGVNAPGNLPDYIAVDWSDYEQKHGSVVLSGLATAPEKLAKQAIGEGPWLVYAFGIALLTALFLSIQSLFRGNRLAGIPLVIVAIALFALINELIVIGAFDFAKKNLSVLFAQPRYRSHLYPLSCIMLAWVFTEGLKVFLKNEIYRKWALVVTCLLAIIAAQPDRRWNRKYTLGVKSIWALPALISMDECRSYLTEKDPFFGWLKTAQALPDGERILASYGDIGRYYFGGRVLTFRRDDWHWVFIYQKEVPLERFLANRVRYVCILKTEWDALPKANLQFWKVISSDKFERVGEFEPDWGWYLLRYKDSF